MKIVHKVVRERKFVCCFLLIQTAFTFRLSAQATVSAYTQPVLQTYLQITPPTQSISYTFWVDQMDACSITVSSIVKNLGIQLTGPTGAVFTFGQVGALSFQSVLYPDPQTYPDAPGANYYMDLGTPAVGQWTIRITVPNVQASVVTLPLNILFDNSVGPVVVGGGGNCTLGGAIPFSAAVMDGDAKVTNLQINATLYRLDDPAVSPVFVTFADDGQGADYSASDAIYSAYVTPGQTGKYKIQLELSGNASTGHFQRSAATGFTVVAQTATITGNFTITPRVKPPQ